MLITEQCVQSSAGQRDYALIIGQCHPVLERINDLPKHRRGDSAAEVLRGSLAGCRPPTGRSRVTPWG
jgi:hypothetical protein